MDRRFEEFIESIPRWQIYSQHGEDAIIKAIFERIGETNRFCFECGAADGLFFSNTRRLIEQGWEALLVECDAGDFERLGEQFTDTPRIRLHQGFISADPVTEHEISLDDVLTKCNAPRDLDLLVLDIDSQEYYILNSMVQYQPRVVIVEYDPDAEEMFIPSLKGKGQAGHLAIRYVAEARGYDVICRTPTNLICVRKDLSHHLKVAPIPETLASTTGQSKQQVFAAGRWQDLDGTVEVLKDEMEAAKEGKLPVRSLVGEFRQVNIGVCMSVPRIGYLDAFYSILTSLMNVGAALDLGFGVFWHHALSRSIKDACEFHDEKSGNGFDYILTADYDSFTRPEDIKKLAEILSKHPEYDALVPMQVKRGGSLEVLAGWEGGRNMTLEVFPVEQAHFGLSIFRREFFARLATPWFWEAPDEHGHWGENRVDADMGFWRNAKECGLNTGLATGVIIGHGEEVISWPRVSNGKVEKVYQPINDWIATRQPPEGIGVIA